MPSIGSVQFQFLNGQPLRPRQVLTKLGRRPGVDGDAWRQEGIAGRQVNLKGHQPILKANLDAALTALDGLSATVQTVVDAYGQTHNNVVIIEATRDRVDPIAVSAGSDVAGAELMLMSNITVQLTE